MDFNKELELYDFFDIEKEIDTSLGETGVILNTFYSAIKRLSKEQNKINISMEELLDITEEEIRRLEIDIGQIKDLRDDSVKLKSDNNSLRNTLIELMDKLELIYRGVSSDDDNPLFAQIKTIWESMKESLPTVGISIIDTEKIPYHSQLHTVLETGHEEAYENYCVLKIIKCGYIFDNGNIRKAKVVVNKLDEE